MSTGGFSSRKTTAIQLPEQAVSALAATFHGELIRPSDDEYDEATLFRLHWNLRPDATTG